MGMLSDFLTLIKGTQTNIEGVLTGKNGKLVSTDIDGTGDDSLVTKEYVDDSAEALDAKIMPTRSLMLLTEETSVTMNPGTKYWVAELIIFNRRAGHKATSYLLERYGANAVQVNQLTESADVTITITEDGDKINFELSVSSCTVIVRCNVDFTLTKTET